MVPQREDNKKKENEPSSPWAWQLTLQANPNSLKFQFKATNKKSRSVKEKLLAVFRKFRFRSARKEPACAAASGVVMDVALPPPLPPPRSRAVRGKFDALVEPKCIGSVIVGFVGLLARSISQKDLKGIILYIPIILLFIAVVFKNLMRKRTWSLVIVTLSIVVVGIYIATSSKKGKSTVSDYVGMLLKKTMDSCSFLFRV